MFLQSECWNISEKCSHTKAYGSNICKRMLVMDTFGIVTSLYVCLYADAKYFMACLKLFSVFERIYVTHTLIIRKTDPGYALKIRLIR